MTHETTFTPNLLFRDISFDSDADNWTFLLEENNYVNASGFWRLLKDDRIQLVSVDHGHQFGLTKPFDLVDAVKDELVNKRLTKLEILENTCDLVLTFDGNIKVQIFIASSGYETYNFSLNGTRYTGLGSGDISIL